MTSNEIKDIILGKLKEEEPFDVYLEFFNQIKENNEPKLIKGIISKWMWACSEIKKETNDAYEIDETFPKSIFCWNACYNFEQSERPSFHFRSFKRMFGWDAKKVAEGKHCKIAELLFASIKYALAIESVKE